jgi:hypothetical protein
VNRSSTLFGARLAGFTACSTAAKWLPSLASMLLALSSSSTTGADPPATATAAVKVSHFSAAEVFDPRRTVIFADNFQSGDFGKWRFSEDANYEIAQADPERIRLADAPGLGDGSRAARLAVRRAPDSFRSEISLPHEKGFQERWYGERLLVPADWVFDPNRGNDIVLQWHAIPGNWRATFPNLEISIGNTNWFIRQSHGNAQSNPTRTNTKLTEPVERGAWVAWVVHARWSPGDDGLLQIWKDGHQVLERHGPNVYSTIGVEYTPYLKTGLYHPEWHFNKEGRQSAFDRETPVATNKVIYVTDVRIGGARATYADVEPPGSALQAKPPPPPHPANP